MRITPYRLGMRLGRVESRWAPDPERENSLTWDIPVYFDNESAHSAIAMGHFHAKTPEGEVQVLGLIYMKLTSEGEPDLTYEQVEGWLTEVGAELLWDFCRRTALTQAGQLEFDLEVDVVSPSTSVRRLDPGEGADAAD